MNYKKIYNSIISYRKNNIPIGYSESHHIIPRCMGGLDDMSNLVRLTAREHFICHLLLVKIYKDTQYYYGLVKAFFMMMVSNDVQNRHTTSKQYEKLKIAFGEAMRNSQIGEGNSQYGTRWITNINTGASYRIKKSDEVPTNCILGRNKKFVSCVYCDNKFIKIKEEKCCSDECRHLQISKMSKERASLEDRKYKNGCRVSVDGVEYDSISHAADCLGIHHETARKRFKSSGFPNWEIVI